MPGDEVGVSALQYLLVLLSPSGIHHTEEDQLEIARIFYVLYRIRWYADGRPRADLKSLGIYVHQPFSGNNVVHFAGFKLVGYSSSARRNRGVGQAITDL